MAHELIAAGVGIDDVVALVVPRSVDWVVGMLAAWKAAVATIAEQTMMAAAAAGAADGRARTVPTTPEQTAPPLQRFLPKSAVSLPAVKASINTAEYILETSSV